MDIIKHMKKSKRYKTAISDKQILLSCNNNKFSQITFTDTIRPNKKANGAKPQSATSRFYYPAIVASCVFVRQNKFRRTKTNLRFPPKSETGYAINSPINNC